jgi:poly(3-hydroxyalkanoate) depolymerase
MGGIHRIGFWRQAQGAEPVTFTFKTITIGSQSLRIATRQGNQSKPPLLIFNGIGASLELVLPFAEKLDPEQGIIAFDVPGVGGSPTPVLPYRFSCLARLATKMLDHLGHAQVDVIGLSWGGFLAQQFAYDHPTHCRRLILAATSCGVAMVPPSLRVLALMASPKRYIDPNYAAEIAPEIYGGEFRTNRDLCISHAAKMQSSGGLGYYYQTGAVWGWTSIHWLHKIKQQTLILSGSDDPLIKIVNTENLARWIPNSDLHVFDDGHLFLLTKAEVAANIITGFLEG